MRSGDVTETLVLAMQASGCDQADVVHKPRLLSDNGSSYLSNELVDWLIVSREESAMRRKEIHQKDSVEKTVREIRRC